MLSDATAKHRSDEQYKKFYDSKHGCQTRENKYQRLWEEVRRIETQLWDARDEIDTGFAYLEEAEKELAAAQNESEYERAEGTRKDKEIASLKEQLAIALAEIQNSKNLSDTVEGMSDCALAGRDM